MSFGDELEMGEPKRRKCDHCKDGWRQKIDNPQTRVLEIGDYKTVVVDTHKCSKCGCIYGEEVQKIVESHDK